MFQPRQVLTFGGLTVAGALIGVQLGHSAVSEINPIYYELEPAAYVGPAYDSYANVSVHRTYASEAHNRPFACDNCDYPIDVRPDPRPIADDLAPSAREPEWRQTAQSALAQLEPVEADWTPGPMEDEQPLVEQMMSDEVEPSGLLATE